MDPEVPFRTNRKFGTGGGFYLILKNYAILGVRALDRKKNQVFSSFGNFTFLIIKIITILIKLKKNIIWCE